MKRNADQAHIFLELPPLEDSFVAQENLLNPTVPDHPVQIRLFIVDGAGRHEIEKKATLIKNKSGGKDSRPQYRYFNCGGTPGEVSKGKVARGEVTLELSHGAPLTPLLNDV